MCRTRYLALKDVWLIDDSPGADHPCRDVIGWPSEAAVDTLKFVSSRSIFPADFSTYRTGLAGIGGINKNHWNTSQFCFVGDKGLKLCESPISESCTLAAGGLNSRPDTTQVFQSDGPIRSVRRLHEGFGDAVVGVFLESSLLAGNLSELSGGCSSLLSLEVPPSMGMLPALFFNGSAGVGFPFAIDGQIDDAEINAENVSGFNQFRFVHVADDGEIPLVANKHQINFAFAEGQKFSLPFTTDESDFLASTECPDTYTVIFDETENPTIVGLSGVLTKGSLNFFVELVGISDFGDATDGDLGSQTKPLTGFVVGQSVKVVLPEGFSFPRLFGQPIAGGVTDFESPLQDFGLFGCGQQFEIYDELHGSSIEEVETLVNAFLKGGGNSSHG